MSDLRPRVCHVIAGFSPTVGGAEKATETLARSTVSRGVDVAVLTRRKPGTEARFLLDGVLVRRAGLPLRGKVGALAFGLHGLWLLATSLRQYRILHVQNIDTPLLMAILARLIFRRRLVATIHSVEDIAGKKESALGRLRLRAFRRWVDRYTAISPALIDELCSLGIERHRIVAIPNPVDTNSISPAMPGDRIKNRQALGITGSDGEVVVLYVGRLVPLKQVDQLLDAFQMAGAEKSLRLVVAGDGPQAPHLRERAATCGIGDRVLFTGMLTDVRPALRAADVFVLPSRQEGLSVALLEALAAGLACVVSDLPGNRELVADGESGIVFPVGDVSALSQALIELEADSELRKRLGLNGRRSLEKQYAVDRVVESHIRVYADVLGDLPQGE